MEYFKLDSVAVGASIFSLAFLLKRSYTLQAPKKVPAKATQQARIPHTLLGLEADDDCHTLYYSKEIGPNGSGFPATKTISNECIAPQRKVHPEYRFLAKELYKEAVENLPIFCVDVVLQRKSDGKLLLFYRRDAPAASIWWWPGGRLFRGETFFQAAIRKVRDETGNPNVAVSTIGVMDVWNTFFPDSAWDAGRPAEKAGTHTVNVIVVCSIDDALSVKDGAENAWAVEKYRWVSVQEALEPKSFDKYVRVNVERAIQRGYLHV